MNSDPRSPAPAESDDPWESLAENLFGTECGKEHTAPKAVPSPEIAEPVRRSEASDEVKPDFPAPVEAVGRADVTPDADVAPTAAETRDLAPAPATRPASAQDSYWDALANWSWDDSEGASPPPTQSARTEEAVPPQRSEPPRHERREGRPPREERGRRGGRRDDRRDRGERGGGGDRSRRPERTDRPGRPQPAPPVPPGATQTTSSRKDSGMADDFGAGLVSEQPTEDAAEFGAETTNPPPMRERASFDDGPEEFVEPAEPETGAAEDREEGGGEEGDFPRKRRRRRRRRRGRGGERSETGAPPQGARETVPGQDWNDSDDESPAAESTVPSDESEEVEPDRVGESESGESSFNQQQRRRGRGGRGREQRRRHGPPPDWSAEDFGAVEAEEQTPPPSDFPETAEAEGPEQFVSYDDVPTWEEAISYLLHPNQVQGESGSGGPPRSPPPSEGQRPASRHYGGRRPPRGRGH